MTREETLKALKTLERRNNIFTICMLIILSSMLIYSLNGTIYYYTIDGIDNYGLCMNQDNQLDYSSCLIMISNESPHNTPKHILTQTHT